MLNFVRSEPKKAAPKPKSTSPEERREISSYVTSIKVRKAAAEILKMQEGDYLSYQKTADGQIYIHKSEEGKGSKLAKGFTFNNMGLRREFLRLAGLDPNETKQHHLIFNVGTPYDNPTLVGFNENDEPIYSETEVTSYFPLTFKEEAPIITRAKKDSSDEGEDDYTEDEDDDLEEVDSNLQATPGAPSTKVGLEDLS